MCNLPSSTQAAFFSTVERSVISTLHAAREIFIGNSGAVAGTERLYVSNAQQRVHTQRCSTVMLHYSSRLVHPDGLEDGAGD
jgi:hypothetical protein